MHSLGVNKQALQPSQPFSGNQATASFNRVYVGLKMAFVGHF